jgi:hypothetical protein
MLAGRSSLCGGETGGEVRSPGWAFGGISHLSLQLEGHNHILCVLERAEVRDEGSYEGFAQQRHQLAASVRASTSREDNHHGRYRAQAQRFDE